MANSVKDRIAVKLLLKRCKKAVDLANTLHLKISERDDDAAIRSETIAEVAEELFKEANALYGMPPNADAISRKNSEFIGLVTEIKTLARKHNMDKIASDAFSILGC